MRGGVGGWGAAVSNWGTWDRHLFLVSIGLGECVESWGRSNTPKNRSQSRAFGDWLLFSRLVETTRTRYQAIARVKPKTGACPGLSGASKESSDNSFISGEIYRFLSAASMLSGIWFLTLSNQVFASSG